MDRFLQTGPILCVNGSGGWSFTYGSPTLGGHIPIASGLLTSPPEVGSWHSLRLTTVKNASSGAYDGKALFSSRTIRTVDAGFAVLATVSFLPMEFDSVSVEEAGHDWGPAAPLPAGCVVAGAGALTGQRIRARRCQANGIAARDQEFRPRPDWQIEHVGSKLCATASAATAGAGLTLQPCTRSPMQLFKLDEPPDDYSDLRNGFVPLVLTSANLTVAGARDGEITLQTPGWSAPAGWTTWVYYPNTKQLRNQKEGYKMRQTMARGGPMCLSLCKDSG